MTRFIIVLLLLIVFFFSGVAYGTFDKTDHLANGQIKTETIDFNYVIEGKDIIPFENNLQPIEPYEINKNNPEVLNKTASMLEKIVNGFFELILSFLYGIVNLFF